MLSKKSSLCTPCSSDSTGGSYNLDMTPCLIVVWASSPLGPVISIPYSPLFSSSLRALVIFFFLINFLRFLALIINLKSKKGFSISLPLLPVHRCPHHGDSLPISLFFSSAIYLTAASQGLPSLGHCLQYDATAVHP